MIRSRFFQLVVWAGAFSMVACSTETQDAPAARAPEIDELEIANVEEKPVVDEQPTILEITNRHGSFEIFSQLIEAADMQETLMNSIALTVLAPTDEAFGKLPEGTVERLLDPENKEELVAILSNHVLPEVYHTADLLDGEQAPTLSGYGLKIEKNKNLKLSNATVLTADIDASNGVIHVVDRVIFAEK